MANITDIGTDTDTDITIGTTLKLRLSNYRKILTNYSTGLTHGFLLLAYLNGIGTSILPQNYTLNSTPLDKVHDMRDSSIIIDNQSKFHSHFT